MLRILPIKSLSLKTVAKRSALSLEGFLREFFLSGCPVVITDCMSQWPARTKWNDMDYLKTVAGDRTVPVEVINLVVPDAPLSLIFVNCFQAAQCSYQEVVLMALRIFHSLQYLLGFNTDQLSNCSC